MKLASMMRTFDKPRRRRRQTASSSFDSGAATTQLLGGWSHLSQSLQTWRVPSRWILEVQVISICSVRKVIPTYPDEASTSSLRQSEHSAPAEVVPSMGAPQLQQRILPRKDI